MTSSPAPGPDGEGIYPHSYERLGAQRGFHISEVLFDATPASTTPRNVTLQTVCARGLVPANPSPHKTVFIRTGETKTATARCPKGQYLITGGFQRTDFTDLWRQLHHRVPGRRAAGMAGDRLRLPRQRRAHRDRLLRQAQGPDPHRGLGLGTGPGGSKRLRDHAALPGRPHPDHHRLQPERLPNAFYAGSSLNSDGTTTANAFGYFGAAPSSPPTATASARSSAWSRKILGYPQDPGSLPQAWFSITCLMCV